MVKYYPSKTPHSRKVRCFGVPARGGREDKYMLPRSINQWIGEDELSRTERKCEADRSYAAAMAAATAIQALFIIWTNEGVNNRLNRGWGLNQGTVETPMPILQITNPRRITVS